MKTYKNNISAIKQRVREAYRRQLLTQPENPCGLCNWSMKYEHARTLITGLEREIAKLRRRLRVRALDHRLKPRSDTYSRQSQR